MKIRPCHKYPIQHLFTPSPFQVSLYMFGITTMIKMLTWPLINLCYFNIICYQDTRRRQWRRGIVNAQRLNDVRYLQLQTLLSAQYFSFSLRTVAKCVVQFFLNSSSIMDEQNRPNKENIILTKYAPLGKETTSILTI